MASHTAHPSIREHGLADGCPRCAEHANNPLDTLDDENLANLWAMMYSVEITSSIDCYRSGNEAKAAGKLYQIQRGYERMVKIATDRRLKEERL